MAFPVAAAAGALGEVFSGLFGGGGGGTINGVSFGDSEFKEAQAMQGRAGARPFEVATIAGNFTRSGGDTYSNDETGRTVSKTPAGAADKLSRALNCRPVQTGQTVQTNKAFGSPGGPRPIYRCSGGGTATGLQLDTTQTRIPAVATPTFLPDDANSSTQRLNVVDTIRASLAELTGNARKEAEALLDRAGEQFRPQVSVRPSIDPVTLIGFGLIAGLGVLLVTVVFRPRPIAGGAPGR